MTEESKVPTILDQDRITDLSTVFREDVEQTVDVIVQDKISKAGITEHEIAEWQKKAQAVMRPVESEADMKALQQVITPLVTMRNRVKAICKRGRETSNMVSKAWIAKEKEYVAMVESIEAPLVKYKEEWKAAQERIKAEEEAEAKRILQVRYAELEAIGMVRRTATLDAPERYEIGAVMLPIDRIDTADLGAWMHMTDTAKAEADKINAEKAEAEAKAKAEADRLEAQAKEIAEKEAKLKDMIVTARTATLRSYGLLNVPSDLAAMTNESFDNYIERERTAKAEEAKQAHIARAVADLKIAGYREANDGSLYLEGNDSGPYTVFPASLYPVDQERWSKLINAGNAYTAKRKEEEAERLRKEGEERAKKAADEAEAARVKAEQDRKSKMGDAARWQEWVAGIKTSAPTMDSEISRQSVSRVLTGLDKITDETFNTNTPSGVHRSTNQHQ